MSIKINLIIDQGSDFNTEFNIVDDNDDAVDLSSYTANSQLRKSYSSNTAYTFTANAFSNGVLTLSMGANVTSTISPGRYFYDIELTSSSNAISRIIEGVATITPGVTR